MASYRNHTKSTGSCLSLVGEDEPQPFADFYADEHEGQVRRAYLLLGSAASAHDVVADAFIAVYRRWDSIDSPGPYLNRCVLNGCRDWAQLSGREATTKPVLGDSAIDQPDGLPESADGLAELLLDLPFRQRAAVVLRFYGGHTEAEIAQALDCRPGTVGSLIHRGLATLRKELS